MSAVGGGQTSAVKSSEIAFVGLVTLVVWIGTETSGGGEVSPWFRSSVLGVPLHYVLFGVMLLLLAPYVKAAPPFRLVGRLRESKLWLWVVLAWGVICLALLLALIRGVPELFADWRNLAVAAVTAVAASKWLQARDWRRYAIPDIATAFGLLCVPILLSYAVGFGATVGGVRTTVFDGTTLYLSAFAAIAASWYALVDSRWLGRVRVVLLIVGGSASTLVVLLSLRRSFWIVWGVGVLTVLVTYMRSREVSGIRLYTVAVGGLVVLVSTFFVLGSDTIGARLESFLPGSTGAFSATNEDHVNDIIDAWRIIERDPILGLGIGQSYETNLIADWKLESFEVHSAVLHVWLKFGVLGALVYLGFHLAWIRSALRLAPSGAVPIGAYLAGVMVATLAGTWPYGRFQIAVFHGLLLALFILEPAPAVATSRRSPTAVARALS